MHATNRSIVISFYKYFQLYAEYTSNLAVTASDIEKQTRNQKTLSEHKPSHAEDVPFCTVKLSFKKSIEKLEDCF